MPAFDVFVATVAALVLALAAPAAKLLVRVEPWFITPA